MLVGPLPAGPMSPASTRGLAHGMNQASIVRWSGSVQNSSGRTSSGHEPVPHTDVGLSSEPPQERHRGVTGQSNPARGAGGRLGAGGVGGWAGARWG